MSVCKDILKNENENAMDYESDEDSDGEENEETTEFETTTCLFCNDQFNSVDLAVGHLSVAHKLNLNVFHRKFNMDQYSYIKFVNYIRQTKTSAEDIASTPHSLWEDEKYLKPLEYEPWLTFDFEHFAHQNPTSDGFENHTDKNDLVVQNEHLNHMIQQLLEKLREKDDLLEQASVDIEKMRVSFNTLIETETDTKPEIKEENVGAIKRVADEGYFSTYSHFGIHHEMLNDTVRTTTYRDAILDNSEYFKGKVVLDVGCGTGILSLFASQAGAKDVVAIDNSEIIYNAMEIAKTNGIENVKFVKGKLEDTKLPVEKYDIIISEWMGYFLLFEGMLDSIIYARKHHLAEGGTLIPNHCNISLVGYGDLSRHKEYVEFWKNVFGYDMSCMQREVLREALIENCSSDFVLTEANIIADFDLMKVDYNYSNFSYNFNLQVLKTGNITSFVGFFDTFFNLPNQKSFSTSPYNKPTHWKQVVFYIKNPVHVNVGDVISGKLTCRRSRNDLRALKVCIEVFQQELNYTID